MYDIVAKKHKAHMHVCSNCATSCSHADPSSQEAPVVPPNSILLWHGMVKVAVPSSLPELLVSVEWFVPAARMTIVASNLCVLALLRSPA